MANAIIPKDEKNLHAQYSHSLGSRDLLCIQITYGDIEGNSWINSPVHIIQIPLVRMPVWIKCVPHLCDSWIKGKASLSQSNVSCFSLLGDRCGAGASSSVLVYLRLSYRANACTPDAPGKSSGSCSARVVEGNWK